MKSNEFWGLYNLSILCAVEKTQKRCKEYAEQVTGEPWAKCKRYFHLVKVTVEPVDS